MDQGQGKGQGMGMFVCVCECACQTPAFSSMDPIVLRVLQINGVGWKQGLKSEGLIPAVMMPRSLMLFDHSYFRMHYLDNK